MVFCFSNDSMDSNQYLIQISLDSAKIDSTLSDEIRMYFEDDDGSMSLKSVSFDINDDGKVEKFIPNEFLCGTGGCPWLIYDPKTKKVIGRIDGSIIYVCNKKNNDYFQLEALLKIGVSGYLVWRYEFTTIKYEVVSKKTISVNKISEYLKEKVLIKK